MTRSLVDWAREAVQQIGPDEFLLMVRQTTREELQHLARAMLSIADDAGRVSLDPDDWEDADADVPLHGEDEFVEAKDGPKTVKLTRKEMDEAIEAAMNEGIGNRELAHFPSIGQLIQLHEQEIKE